jgi:hypothetical protein
MAFSESELMPINPVVKRMAHAIYKKAEALGVEIDPEGCGDLTRATLIAIAAFDAIFDQRATEEAQ